MNEDPYSYLGGADAAAAAADNGSGWTLGGFIGGLTDAAKAAGQVYKDISNAPKGASTAKVAGSSTDRAKSLLSNPLVIVGAVLALVVGLWLALRK